MPRVRQITLKGRVIVEGQCRSEALVSSKPLSFLGGVNPNDGTIIEKDHDLHGKCVRDKVLCFPYGHGSTVGSYILYSLRTKGLAPKAIINQKADPVIVVGAIIAEIPMIDQVDIGKIRTDDIVNVDAYDGTIRVSKRNG